MVVVSSDAVPGGTPAGEVTAMKVTHVISGPTTPGDGLGEAGTRGSSLVGGFTIVITPGATLSEPEYTGALAAFNRAAAQWEALISDPITVNIDADLDALPPNVIGSTDSVMLQGEFHEIRDVMIADAADEPDDGIVAHLPTVLQYSALVPDVEEGEFTLDEHLVATKANLKAMGFTGLDDEFGTSDGTITFSTDFSFDFDNSNGVDPGKMDFETVAAHEIGHVLGFVSQVDEVDALLEDLETLFETEESIALKASVLDLFGFANDTPDDPSSASEFTTFPRLLTPGNDGIFDQIYPADDSDAEILLSEGFFNGDGRQASHWKDNNLTGILIGIMDPTLANGDVWQITDSDLRALDLIGYDMIVPEPTTLILLAGGLPLLLKRKRLRLAASSSQERKYT